MTEWNLLETPSFTAAEMGCKCGNCDGSAKMDHDFMVKLQNLRDAVGPLNISSGYRCKDHPAEAKKSNPGAHNQGKAADIYSIDSKNKFQMLVAAPLYGMVGIGVGKTFIHVDDGHEFANRPALWGY